MTRVLEGAWNGAGLRVALVAARFNEAIVDRLVDGAIDGLRRSGVDEAQITVVRVPGAFEIPQAARRALESGRFDAIVCLGAIIRGATPHFEHVASACTSGVADLARHARIPVIFGVLTCDTIEQAVERAGTKAGNKGRDAALAAVEMASLYRALDDGR